MKLPCILKCKGEAISTKNFRGWSLNHEIKQLYKVVDKPKGLVTLCVIRE